MNNNKIITIKDFIDLWNEIGFEINDNQLILDMLPEYSSETYNESQCIKTNAGDYKYEYPIDSGSFLDSIRNGTICVPGGGKTGPCVPDSGVTGSATKMVRVADLNYLPAEKFKCFNTSGLTYNLTLYCNPLDLVRCIYVTVGGNSVEDLIQDTIYLSGQSKTYPLKPYAENLIIDTTVEQEEYGVYITVDTIEGEVSDMSLSITDANGTTVNTTGISEIMYYYTHNVNLTDPSFDLSCSINIKNYKYYLDLTNVSLTSGKYIMNSDYSGWWAFCESSTPIAFFNDDFTSCNICYSSDVRFDGSQSKKMHFHIQKETFDWALIPITWGDYPVYLLLKVHLSGTTFVIDEAYGVLNSFIQCEVIDDEGTYTNMGTVFEIDYHSNYYYKLVDSDLSMIYPGSNKLLLDFMPIYESDINWMDYGIKDSDTNEIGNINTAETHINVAGIYASLQSYMDDVYNPGTTEKLYVVVAK